MSEHRYKFEEKQVREIAARLKLENPHYTVRILPDNSIAILFDLIYTRAIATNVDEVGFENRFCFEDRQLANEEFEKLNSCDDEPTGWIARR